MTDDPLLHHELQPSVQVTNERTTKLRLQKAKVAGPLVKLCLLGQDDQPLSGANVKVTAGGASQTLVTNFKGRVDVVVAKTTTGFTLRVDAPGLAPDVDVPARVLPLEPVAAPAGQLARLRNLGYFTGDLPGEAPGADEDPHAARSALEEFQCDQGLPVTGTCDAATQARLTQAHGS